MGLIITPTSPTSEPTPFYRLLDNPEQYEATVRRMMMILAGSFRTDQQRTGKGYRSKAVTEHEKRRRMTILIKWFRLMRSESGYSLQRTLDELPRALRTELDGRVFEPPPKNRLWTPEGVFT
jgi:hypothetical protein